MINKKWLILIVGTNKIFPQFYQNDPQFNKDNYLFINVSDENVNSNFVNILKTSDIENYQKLGYPYAESEVIYNIYKLNLFNDYEYIGIIHYDFNLYSKRYKTSKITESIDYLLNNGIEYISFQNMNLGYIYKNANIMLDERDKNCVFPQFSNLENPRTSFDYTFDHINKINDTNYSIKNFDLNQNINMCCSFLMKREIFNKLGLLVSNMIDEHYMDIFDYKKINRIPGNVIERTVGIFSLFHKHIEFDLEHKHITSDEFIKNGTFNSTVRYE